MFYGLFGIVKFENVDFQGKSDNVAESNFYNVPIDYKFHCFGSEISHIETITNRFVEQGEIAMDLQWQPMPFRYQKHPNSLPIKPSQLELMTQIAYKICLANYARIDLYNINNRVIVGEFTLTPAGGTDIFTPSEWDKKLGEMWR